MRSRSRRPHREGVEEEEGRLGRSSSSKSGKRKRKNNLWVKALSQIVTALKGEVSVQQRYSICEVRNEGGGWFSAWVGVGLV